MIKVEVFLSCLLDNGFYEIHDDGDPADILYIATNDNRHYLSHLTLVDYMDTMGQIIQYTPSHYSINEGFVTSYYFIDELMAKGKFEFEIEEEALYFKLKFCS